MNTKMYVANLIVQGVVDSDGVVRIETYPHEVNFYDASDKYLDYHSVDSERLGPDKYDFELDEESFTLAEIQEYIDSGSFAAEHMAYQKEKREATARIAELVELVTPAMNELLTLANKYNIPANIKVGKYTNDFRLIDAVDWDSSSMYC